MSFNGPPPPGSRGPPPPPGGTRVPPPPLGGGSDPPSEKRPPPPYQQTRDAPGGNLGDTKNSGRSAGNEDPVVSGSNAGSTFVEVEVKLPPVDYRNDNWDPIHYDAFQPNGYQNMQYKIQQSSSVLTARTSNAQYTPLHLAVKFNRPDNVRTLLAAGAPVDCEDVLGQTPFILACRYEVDGSILQELVSRRPDFEHVDKFSWTALFWTCRYGRWSATRELLRAGVRRDCRDRFGRTPYDVAANDLIQRLFG